MASCRFSGYAWLSLLKKTITAYILQTLDCLFREYVYPFMIRSDSGPQFRLAAMMLTPTRKNAPTVSLEIMNDFIPLELALQETAHNAYHRLKLMTQASWPYNNVKKTQCDSTHKNLITTNAQATGLRQDTETIIESIEDKNY